MVEISTYQIGIFVFDLRACLSTFFFDRKCPVETKYSDLIGCDFNYRSLFRSWLRSRPIRSGFLFSTAHFRSKNKVLRHALTFSIEKKCAKTRPHPCSVAGYFFYLLLEFQHFNCTSSLHPCSVVAVYFFLTLRRRHRSAHQSASISYFVSSENDADSTD